MTKRSKAEHAEPSGDPVPDEVIRDRHLSDPAARARALDALERVKRGLPSKDVIEPEELERFLREHR